MGLLDNEDKDDFSGYILRRQYEMDEDEYPRKRPDNSIGKCSVVILLILFFIAIGIICWIFRKP